MKKTYYLISTASGRMGGDNSYSTMSEEELFKEKNKSYFDCPYTTIYKLMDKQELVKAQKKIKKSPLTLKEELEIVQEQLAWSHRAYRFAGPITGETERRKQLEDKIYKLKSEIKKLK